MPPAGFEPAIPAGERLQTHPLDRSTTGIDVLYQLLKLNEIVQDGSKWWFERDIGKVRRILSYVPLATRAASLGLCKKNSGPLAREGKLEAFTPIRKDWF